MFKRVALHMLVVVTGLSGFSLVCAQEAGFRQAEMWLSRNDTATGNFSAAILASNPAGDLAFLSANMPGIVAFDSTAALGDEPYRILSGVLVVGVEKTFTFVFDTSDGTPFIGVNAYPGAGGGPTDELCFEAGNSLAGNMPIKVSDIPFSIVHTHAETYDDSGDLLLQLDDVPYVIKSGDTDVELNICFYHLDGTPVGPSRPASMQLTFRISTDVIFQDDFE